MAAEPLSKYIIAGYQSNGNVGYSFRQQSNIASGVGNVVIAQGTAHVPPNLKMRYVLGKSEDGFTAKAFVGNPASLFIVYPFGQSWNGNGGVTYKATGSVGEKYRGK